MPNSLFMPGVMALIEVVPPISYSNSGLSSLQRATIAPRFLQSGSQAYLASVPAFWPRAEKVTWERRFSIISSPGCNLSSSQKPSSLADCSMVFDILATCSSVKG